MKSSVYFVAIFILFLTACGSDEEQVQNIPKRYETIEEIDNARMRGEITDEKAELLKMEIRENKIEKRKKNAPEGIPDWAAELGLTEPEGMKLDPLSSQITSEDDTLMNFNSVLLVYRGDYDTAMVQAERIAEAAGIPITREFQNLYDADEEIEEMKEDYGSRIDSFDVDEPRGIVYANYDLDQINGNSRRNLKYAVTIQVFEDGKLSIYVVDYDQMKKQLDNVAP